MNLARRLERLEKNLVVIAESQPPPRSLLQEVKVQTLARCMTPQELDFMMQTLKAESDAEAQGLSFEFPAAYKALLARLDEELEVTALERTGRPWAALVEEERQRLMAGGQKKRSRALPRQVPAV